MKDSPNSPKTRRLDGSVILIFIAAVAIAFISAALRDRLNRPPFAEEASIALHLVHSDGFLSPYDSASNAPPTCINAPLYPVVIAAAFRIGESHAVLVLLAINSICFGVMAAGVFMLGRLYLSSAAGLIGALLLMAHPVLLYFVTDWWDSYVALGIFVVLIVATAEMHKTRHPWRASALMGAGMGVLSLTNPSYTLTYPLLVLVGLAGRSRRDHFAGIAMALVGFAVVLAPWTVRNLLVFDRLYFVRGGMGFQTWLGNQSMATGWLEGDILLASPAINDDERSLILRLGEPKYFDLCDQRVMQEYRDATGDFWARSAKRMAFIFMSDPTKAYLGFPMMKDVRWRGVYWDRAVLHGIVLLLGLTGVWTAWRLRLGCVWIFGAALLAEAPFVPVFVSDRYNLPMRVVLLLFIGILFGCVAYRYRHGVWPGSPEN